MAKKIVIDRKDNGFLLSVFGERSLLRELVFSRKEVMELVGCVQIFMSNENEEDLGEEWEETPYLPARIPFNSGQPDTVFDELGITFRKVSLCKEFPEKAISFWEEWHNRAMRLSLQDNETLQLWFGGMAVELEIREDLIAKASENESPLEESAIIEYCNKWANVFIEASKPIPEKEEWELEEMWALAFSVLLKDEYRNIDKLKKLCQSEGPHLWILLFSRQVSEATVLVDTIPGFEINQSYPVNKLIESAEGIYATQLELKGPDGFGVVQLGQCVVE